MMFSFSPRQSIISGCIILLALSWPVFRILEPPYCIPFTYFKTDNFPNWIPACRFQGTGFVTPGFESVKDVFAASFLEGREFGAQLAVFHNGNLVVNLAGGSAFMQGSVGDREKEILQTTEPDFVGPIFSCTKVAESVVIAMLVDRGLLDLKMPISFYWPEFAVNGKENITVRQLMRHQAGVAALDEPVPLYELEEGKHMELAERLAQQPVNWVVPPDDGHKSPQPLEEKIQTKAGVTTHTAKIKQLYHSVTRGLYASELCRCSNVLNFFS